MFRNRVVEFPALALIAIVVGTGVPATSKARVSFAASSGENAMPQMDNLIALVAVGIGLADTVAVWLLGILMANGFVWPRLNPTGIAPPRSLPSSFLPRAARQCIRPKRIPLANTSDKNDSAEAAAMPIPMAAM